MPIILSILLSLILSTSLVATTPQSLDNPTNRVVPWGVYQILWSTDQFERELDQQLDQLGGTPGMYFFRDLHPGRDFPLKAVEICHRKNLVPIISFEPAPWGRPMIILDCRISPTAATINFSNDGDRQPLVGINR